MQLNSLDSQQIRSFKQTSHLLFSEVFSSACTYTEKIQRGVFLGLCLGFLWLCLLFKGTGRLRVFFKIMEPEVFNRWVSLVPEGGCFSAVRSAP